MKTLKSVDLELVCRKRISDDDEYTRQTRSMRGSYNMELGCNETIVLFINFISLLVENDWLVKIDTRTRKV